MSSRIFFQVFFYGIVFLGLASHLASAETSESEPQSPGNVVGSLPYSNQWEYEKTDSMLFVTYDSQTLVSSQFSKNNFNAKFPSTSVGLYGLNYLIRMSDVMSAQEGHKNLSLWLKSSLGFAAPSSSISSADTPLSSASNTGQLFLGKLGTGPMLSWDLNTFIRPFIAAEFSFYTYRHTAGISTIDFSGQGVLFEPMVGVESKLIDPVHIIAQVGYTRALSRGDSSLLTDGTSVALGLGVMF